AAEAHLRAGRVDEAATLVEQAIAIAEFAESTHYLGLARRVQGEIFVAREEYDDALRAYDGAIAAFEECGSRLELGRAWYHRASLQLAHGDAAHRAAARSEAARARDAFAAMGAAHDRAMAERLLA